MIFLEKIFKIIIIFWRKFYFYFYFLERDEFSSSHVAELGPTWSLVQASDRIE